MLVPTGGGRLDGRSVWTPRARMVRRLPSGDCEKPRRLAGRPRAWDGLASGSPRVGVRVHPHPGGWAL
eukprot:1405487-Alexandrium_andersonii.AAC.1